MDYRFELIDRMVVYDGFFRLDSCRLRHRMFNGAWSPEIQRECLERGHAVAVLLYDAERDQVILLEQFRVGALDFPGGPWLLEVVAGMIGAGETDEDVARREAVEEAGCDIGNLVPICRFLVSPGGTSESITLFCGQVDSRGVGGIHGLSAEHEDIRVEVVSRTEAFEMVRSGRINNATPIIALQWLELNYRRLQDEWGPVDAP
jgi:ADP-ribose pyrophosphatase